jgi:hypothetical protein
MSYGFDKTMDTVRLPKLRENPPQKPATAPTMAPVLQAAQELGFVSREVSTRRKPGPKRTEPQDKITVTGPKRVMDRLKAYCDRMGGVSYCDGIQALLDDAEKSGT